MKSQLALNLCVRETIRNWRENGGSHTEPEHRDRTRIAQSFRPRDSDPAAALRGRSAIVVPAAGLARRKLMTDYPLARRTLISSARLSLGAGLVSAIESLRPQVAAAEPTPVDIWSSEYWAHKGEVKLNLWRKRLGEPRPAEPPLPILFLVHGSSLSARSSYDLVVPGNDQYSLMNVFALAGYDVWTMDHDGYGYSGSSGNNSDIISGVEDLKAAIPVVERETGRQKMSFFGTSSGDPDRPLWAAA
jgi:hypothetical protein